MAIDPSNANGAADALTPEGPGEYAAPDAVELERLRAQLDEAIEQRDEAIEERDRLQQEVNQIEVDMETRVDIDRGQRAALAHGRSVIESAVAADAFTRTMNERAADAISELLGDR